MLTHAYNLGARAAILKLALAPPTQVDEFVAAVESGKDMPLDTSTDVPPDPLAAPRDISEGVKAALAKFAVSNALVARAAQSTAQRGGGRIGQPLISAITGGNPTGRALYNPRLQAGMPQLREQARAPGTFTPSNEQKQMQTMMNQVPRHGAIDRDRKDADFKPDGIRQRAIFDSMLHMTGRVHQAPGVNKQILDSFGSARGGTPSQQAATVPRAKTPVAPPMPNHRLDPTQHARMLGTEPTQLAQPGM